MRGETSKIEKKKEKKRKRHGGRNKEINSQKIRKQL